MVFEGERTPHSYNWSHALSLSSERPVLCNESSSTSPDHADRVKEGRVVHTDRQERLLIVRLDLLPGAGGRHHGCIQGDPLPAYAELNGVAGRGQWLIEDAAAAASFEAQLLSPVTQHSGKVMLYGPRGVYGRA